MLKYIRYDVVFFLLFVILHAKNIRMQHYYTNMFFDL